ncbi:GcvT family protein [Williamsia deligens]|uniref:FAD-dependent oxidoreductase n=1 Tax=Williamsia deligens TaxID=321325 RepID=A0ABW3GGX2_9NOCA|nr:FAD-dependent oxidoreductase [Williamsia deligens]MCP2195473.1 Glycine cleavage system T protein (aminomethyltransferase) [Williamsia deligens]
MRVDARHGPRVVVIGAGIVGTSLADELVLRGWGDVTVIDRGPLPAAGGSSSHAPGLVFATNVSRTLSDLAAATVEKFRGLTSEADLCFNAVGGLEIATTPARLDELHRKAGWAAAWGRRARVVDADECARLHPLLDRDVVLGGLHTPDDGLADALTCIAVQRRRAEAGGARFLGDTCVLGVLTSGDHVVGVRTDAGVLDADIVVSCGGFWGAQLGGMVGLTVPLVPMGHDYVTTTPVPGARAIADRRSGHAAATAPILRHQDADLYYRQHGDRIGIGWYGHDPVVVDMATLYDDTAGQPMPSMLPFDPRSFDDPWRESQRVLPALRDAEIGDGFTGIFSFTPDGGPMLGPHPYLAGFWVAEAIWVTQSAGAASAVADWMVHGTPGVDVSGCDVSRFADAELSAEAVVARSSRAFVEVYDIVHPRAQPRDARDLRTSALHADHLRRGAHLGVSHGLERPLWFGSNAALRERFTVDTPAFPEWFTREWSPIVLSEAVATRAVGAMYDMSSLTRVEVTGTDAVAVLGPLVTRDLDRPVGAVVYALMLDESGGILSDVTVARLGDDRLLVGVNGPLDVTRLGAAICRARADGADVAISEITDDTTCVGVWGPRAGEIVGPLTDLDLSPEGLRYYRCAETTIAGVPAVVSRVSYVGEFGWEISTRRCDAVRLADALSERAEYVGAVWAGRGAMDCLRIEKGYRSWGTDMSRTDSPHEAGLAFAVGKEHDFVGRSAVRERPVRRRLHTIVADDPATVMLGGEPMRHDGSDVGYVTSATWSPTLGRTIAYAWGPDELRPGDAVDVDWFGTPQALQIAPPVSVDPENRRVKGIAP